VRSKASALIHKGVYHTIYYLASSYQARCQDLVSDKS
jgi:hypothetical protein